jgi:hypothetical protein
MANADGSTYEMLFAVQAEKRLAMIKVAPALNRGWPAGATLLPRQVQSELSYGFGNCDS